MQNDNKYNDRIGLVVWGCKGGKRVFCSRVVDVKSKVISDTIKDIRSFILFNHSFLTTYAVEFTNDYKVFTIYRSCNDNGTGGYVAITVYVPHDLKVRNMRQALTDRMDEYFKEFVHPVFGTYIAGTYDSIDQYNEFIYNTLDILEDKEHFVRSASVQDDRPHLLVYKSDGELDGYFDRPYRKEFYVCQEVMFMSEALRQNEGKDFSFNFKPDVITTVSNPEKLPHLKLQDDKRVVSVKVNGKECEKSQELPVNDTDTVKITLRQDRCEDLVLSGFVSSLKSNSQLQEKDKAITIGSNIQFTYKKYPVCFTLNGNPVPENLLTVRVSQYGSDISVTNSVANIPGDKLNQDCKIYLINANDENKTPISLGAFKPSEFVDNRAKKDVQCEKHKFTVEFEKKCEGCFYINVGNYALKIKAPSLSGKSVEVYLSNVSVLSFDTDSSLDYNYDSESKVLTLTQKTLEFELYIPKEVKKYVTDWDFTFHGESRKKSGLWSKNDIVLNSGEDVNSGKLIINKNERDFDVVGKTIYPKILLVKIDDDNKTSIKFKVDGELRDTINSCITSYKDSCEIKCKTPGYTFVTENDRGVFVAELKKEVNENTDDPTVCFYGCQGLYVSNQDKKIKIRNKEYNIKIYSQYIVITTKFESKRCKVFREERDYKEADRNFNKKKGFEVSYLDGDKKIEVRRKSWCKKPSLFGKLNGKLKIIAKMIGILSVIAILGIGGYFVWNYINKPNEILIAKIPVKLYPNTFGDEITNIYGVGKDLRFWGKDTISVYYKTDSEETPNLSEITISFDFRSGSEIKDEKLPDGIQKSISKAISKAQNKDFKPATTQLFTLNSPIEQAYNNLQDTATIELYVKVLGKWTDVESKAKFAEAVLRKAHKSIQPSDTAKMKNFINEFKAYSKCREYKAVKEQLDSARSKANEEQRNEDLKVKATNNKNDMQKMNISLEKIKEIEEWWNGLSANEKITANRIYSFEYAIKIYYRILTPTDNFTEFNRTINDSNGYLGPEQKKLLEKYKGKEDNYKQWQKKAASKNGKQTFKDIPNF